MFHYYADEKKIRLYKNLAGTFKGIIKKQGLDVRNMVDNGVEDDISNILKTQKVWSNFGWVSNIDHMKSMNCTDDDFTRIKMIIWMKKDTVYTDFIKLMTDDSEDEMKEELIPSSS